MPYIKQEERKVLDFGGVVPSTVGELTYTLTKQCMLFLRRNGPWRFADIAQVLGALEATKLEFYRRIASKYEDEKCEENGDVF